MTIAIGVVGALPAAFTWLPAHNTPDITSYFNPPVAMQIRSWFGAHWAYLDYYPLSDLSSCPAPGREITDQMELARHGAHCFEGLLTKTAATLAAHTLLLTVLPDRE
jgi:hypothetical protein